jgi:hypothetical protein
MGCAVSAVTAANSEGADCGPGLLMWGCRTRVSTLPLLLGRPGFGYPVQGGGERLMIGEDVKLSPFQQVPEMTNPRENG